MAAVSTCESLATRLESNCGSSAQEQVGDSIGYKISGDSKVRRSLGLPSFQVLALWAV